MTKGGSMPALCGKLRNSKWRIIRLEALMEMKRLANHLKDLADLEALQKIAPYR